MTEADRPLDARRRRRHRIIGVVALALLALIAVAAAPYWWPLGWGLGPCGHDWTSPTSYLPRKSPSRSLHFSLSSPDGAVTQAKLCYSSPAVRGREIFGGLVPWYQLWRTGANEPTRLFLDGPVELAGVVLEQGRYSLYTEPSPQDWRLFVSSDTFHWGNQINAAVRAKEVGVAVLEPQPLEEVVEDLAFRFVPSPESDAGPSAGELRLEWDRTRLAIPLRAR